MFAKLRKSLQDNAKVFEKRKTNHVSNVFKKKRKEKHVNSVQNEQSENDKLHNEMGLSTIGSAECGFALGVSKSLGEIEGDKMVQGKANEYWDTISVDTIRFKFLEIFWHINKKIFVYVHIYFC